MQILMAAAGGILPMLIYALIFYRLDRFEREPGALVIGVFFWGFIPAAILSMITQLLLGMPLFLFDETGALSTVVSSIVLAPITEEIFKGMAVLLVFLIWRHEFDNVMDGIIYGSMVGFGFAAIENTLYFASYPDPGLFILRALVFGLNHALYTSFTGLGLAAARQSPPGFRRVILPFIGLFGAITMHAIHNVLATGAAYSPELTCIAIAADYFGLLFLFIVMIAALRKERQIILDELTDEVKSGLITSEIMVAASEPLKRLSFGLGSRRLFEKVVELAYRKRDIETGNTRVTSQEIEALRTDILQLSPRKG